MPAFTKLEKLVFPGFLLVFEIVFLILFGLLVEYDDRGDADPSSDTFRESGESVRRTYPCELQLHRAAIRVGILQVYSLLCWIISSLLYVHYMGYATSAIANLQHYIILSASK